MDNEILVLVWQQKPHLRRKIEEILLQKNKKFIDQNLFNSGKGLSARDRKNLRQSICISIIPALHRFDFGRGVKFKSYWAWWVRHAVNYWWRLESSVVRPEYTKGKRSFFHTVELTHESSVEENVDQYGIHRLLDTLNEKDKSIMVDYYFNDIHQKTIGARLGISDSRIQQLMTRIKSSLKTRIKV